MNFEEIITEHNDKLVAIFVEANETNDQAKLISGMFFVTDAVDALNGETQEKLGKVFDRAFLANNDISPKAKKK
jgi:hypothetical protein